MGADITVPTIDGKIKYSDHEGTQHNDNFKLKGKGITHLGGTRRGDAYVKVTI